MSRTEDYLDELLHSVSKTDDEDQDIQLFGKKQSRSRSAEDDFLNAFEEEILASEDPNELLQQFEEELDLGGRGFDGSAAAEENMESMHPKVMEMEGVQEVSSDIGTENGGMTEDLDDILNNAREKMDVRGPEDAVKMESPGEPDIPIMDELPKVAADKEPVQEDFGGMDIMIDTMGDIPQVGDDADYGESSDLTRRLGDIADATENLSAMGELGEEFGLDEFDAEQPVMEEETIETAEMPEEEPDGKKKKKTRKERKKEKQKAKESAAGQDGEQEMSFLQKMSRIVFGEDEEDEEDEKAVKKAVGEDAESDTGSDGEKAKKGKKEKKPKEKKPKKEKKKKEKPKKPAKPPKPKKEKKPKEPDLTPPLPKAPVILIFIMTASLMALILIGTNVVGYANQFAEADEYYKLGNYTEAYRAVRGVEVKERDQDTFEKYRIMATIAGEYNSYQSFMEASIYDMALDSLIRAVGRSEKYHADARTYECTDELESIKEQAVAALSGFGLDEAGALELYNIREKADYSIEVHEILINAGLVTEE